MAKNIILLSFLIMISCNKSIETSEPKESTLDKKNPCTMNLDSLKIEVNKKVSFKYGDIFEENYAGMTLVDSDSQFFVFKGATRVWKNPDLDSLPQVIFNYKTCEVESIRFIKVKPYQKS